MNTTLMESNVRANAAAETGEQYSLGKILGIWASVAHGTHPVGAHANPDPTRGSASGIPVSQFDYIGVGLAGRCCLHHPQAGSETIHMGKHQREIVVICPDPSQDRRPIEQGVPLDNPIDRVIPGILSVWGLWLAG